MRNKSKHIYLKPIIQSYYECKRCKTDSLDKKQNVPCPRGSCEALPTGQLITTRIIRKLCN